MEGRKVDIKTMNLIFKRFNNGFTLIELLIVLALAGVIVSIIISILFTNINIFHKTDRDIELQQQGQFIIGFLEKKIIESCGTIYLEDMNGHVKHETYDKANIKKIIFKNIPEAENEGYIFQLSKDSKYNTFNLKYGKGLSGTPTVEVGNYIEKIEVEPIPSNKIYTEAKGLNLELSFDIDGQKKVFKTQLFFRNAFRR